MPSPRERAHDPLRPFIPIFYRCACTLCAYHGDRLHIVSSHTIRLSTYHALFYKTARNDAPGSRRKYLYCHDLYGACLACCRFGFQGTNDRGGRMMACRNDAARLDHPVSLLCESPTRFGGQGVSFHPDHHFRLPHNHGCSDRQPTPNMRGTGLDRRDTKIGQREARDGRSLAT